MQTKEKVLLVGDPHLKLSRIEDAKEFCQKLVEKAIKGGYTKVIILGDMFDTFAVIRSEILTLWFETILKISEVIGKDNIILIVGNHDYAGAKGGSHSLEPFKTIATVIDHLDFVMIGGLSVAMIPFMRENQEFESLMRELPEGDVLFCHQSFNGAKFENGFYDPHGADPESVAHLSKVVSGHIHSRQTVGHNIYYPGTPFQQSFGEAGQEKGLVEVLIGTDVEGKVQVTQEIDLEMPKFYVVDGMTLPEVDPRGSYKFIGEASPQEIAEFWRSDAVRDFRMSVRRVVDAMVPKRESGSDLLEKVTSTEDKLEAFIRSKNWRVSQEVLIGRARTILAE